MIAPSSCLWIVSPWISDIPVIDNKANTFQYLETSWNRGKVRFSQVIKALVDVGTTIHIATRPLSHNQAFLEKIMESAHTGKVKIHRVDVLHEKGIVGDDFHLGGSMNFTYNGISINEESVTYETSPDVVAERRLVFKSRWGGEAQ
jgi:phosphatidylserine/phosphatidylglycerophosphate/cardiolipin synthase-like enzyme